MSTLPSADKSAEIRVLNDKFRLTGIGGKVFITQGIAALSELDQSAIVHKVRTFDTFTEGDDPYGEHDFGAFTHNGRKIFWKIDYYDLAMEFGSEDPSDSEKTVRVLTILLADEY